MTLTLWIFSIIQGLTEFLPVSSSGHLVLAKIWLGFKEHGLEMELWLHLATLFSLLLYFRRDIARLFWGVFDPRRLEPDEQKWPLLILIATAITGAFGAAERKALLASFGDAATTYWGFVISGLILLATRGAKGKRHQLTPGDAVWFGLAQALSIIPSISRSGTTIACLLFLGVDRATAFRFSFIASIPAIAGAFLFELNAGSFAGSSPFALASSFVVTFFLGLGSLVLLKRFVLKERFYWFGFYCLALGLLGLAAWR